MKIVETRRRRKAYEEKLRRAKRRAMWAFDIETYTGADNIPLNCVPVKYPHVEANLQYVQNAIAHLGVATVLAIIGPNALEQGLAWHRKIETATGRLVDTEAELHRLAMQHRP